MPPINLAASEPISITEDHLSAQFETLEGDNNIFDGRVVVKFKIPITVRTENEVPWVFLQPQYHNNMDLQVVNGVVSGENTLQQSLNIITLVTTPREEAFDIIIRKGDVLAYMWFPSPTQLEYSDQEFVRTTSRFVGYELIKRKK